VGAQSGGKRVNCDFVSTSLAKELMAESPGETARRGRRSLRGGGRPSHFEADSEGRFRVNPGPGDRFGVTTQSPEGQPYLVVSKRIEWPKGAVEQPVDVALPRGVAISGKVTEEGSGKPVAGAVVAFRPNTIIRTAPVGMSTTATTRWDGSFQIAALPGPGFLIVQGPSDEFVLRVTGADLGVDQARPSGRRFYAHAFTFLDVKPSSTGHGASVTLERGLTVKGRVVGPDDRPVPDALIISRLILRAMAFGGWKLWLPQTTGHVRDGRFQLHGLDQDTNAPVYFFMIEKPPAAR